MLQALEFEKFKEMTTIQSLCLKDILEKKDVIVKSKTGSGKTLCFALPLANEVKSKPMHIQSLILAPTRELANQINLEIKKVLRFIPNIKVLSLCGGTPFKPQVASLEVGAHIVVGTVGRVLQHIHETKIDFSNVNSFVLDEADKMLDMGFYEDILKIADYIPKKRQTLLFSATYEKEIEELSSKLLDKPLFIENVETHKKESITQKFYETTEDRKIDDLLRIISHYKMKTILIFCNTKAMCEDLSNQLWNKDVESLTLHSDLDQRDRDETVILFSNGSLPILIATDIVSRGIDIDNIDFVINFNIARDETIHTHRIGRTARGEKKGIAITLYDNDEFYKVKPINEKFPDIEFCDVLEYEDSNYKPQAEYKTLLITGGKKHKLRKGDILGALTAGEGLDKDLIGNITILDFVSFVAVKNEVLDDRLLKLGKIKIKKKLFKLIEK
ncbi:ATP-dependent RNA helicase DbpA [Halarcobacter sp.]|uniref:ATP-dependent RNA helicase DbpA n=1 Tax=Halarcobacter sp. TaxID=2321133 RepID=UPI0029F4F503|nr:ATP-dependent RNA helicase DbpA [Halarcobacter sp.]